MPIVSYHDGVERISDALRANVESYRAIPIFINSRDRLHGLRRLISWLTASGYANICILDNASSYPPLLRFLAQSEHPVLRLHRNLGHDALWRVRQLRQSIETSPFVYTDPDIVPTETCPRDALGHLYSLLGRHSQYLKAGLGLLLDDIPATNPRRDSIIAWELILYGACVEPNVFEADVDTTFAVYRRNAPYSTAPALRTRGVYQARHLPWYTDHSADDAETRYYIAHARRGTTHLTASQEAATSSIPIYGSATGDPDRFLSIITRRKAYRIARLLALSMNAHHISRDELAKLPRAVAQEAIITILTSDDWRLAQALSYALDDWRSLLSSRLRGVSHFFRGSPWPGVGDRRGPTAG